MRRCIVLLLIIGTAWAQTGLDKIVLKDGTEYLGKYLRTEKRLVYFNQHKSKNERLARIISIQDVSTLQLMDGGSVDFEFYEKNYPKEYKNSKLITLRCVLPVIVGFIILYSMESESTPEYQEDYTLPFKPLNRVY